MDAPLTGGNLIPHRSYAQVLTHRYERVPGDETKEATMTIKLVALVLLCLMSGTAVAQEPKVTSVEHAPGGSSAIHRHNAHAFVYVLEAPS